MLIISGPIILSPHYRSLAKEGFPDDTELLRRRRRRLVVVDNGDVD